MFQFIQISVQMLDTHLMIGADYRAFQQTPNTLYSVGMNPFLCGVINPLVFRVGILDAPISWHFVGVDRFRVWRGVIRDEFLQRRLVSVSNNLQPNLSLALYGSNGDSFVALVASSHAAHLSADMCFVHFYNA